MEVGWEVLERVPGKLEWCGGCCGDCRVLKECSLECSRSNANRKSTLGTTPCSTANSSRPDSCSVDFGRETPKFRFEFCGGFFGGFFPPIFPKEKGPKKSTEKSPAKFTWNPVRKNSPRISAEAFSWQFFWVPCGDFSFSTPVTDRHHCNGSVSRASGAQERSGEALDSRRDGVPTRGVFPRSNRPACLRKPQLTLDVKSSNWKLRKARPWNCKNPTFLNGKAVTPGGTNLVFGKPYFCPCQRGAVLTKTAKMTNLHSTLATETRFSLLRPPKTTKMTEMVGVTQTQAWFRKSRVCASLSNCLFQKTPHTEGVDKVQGSVDPRFAAVCLSRCPKRQN